MKAPVRSKDYEVWSGWDCVFPELWSWYWVTSLLVVLWEHLELVAVQILAAPPAVLDYAAAVVVVVAAAVSAAAVVSYAAVVTAAAAVVSAAAAVVAAGYGKFSVGPGHRTSARAEVQDYSTAVQT
jgi:hypothetical protein